MTLCVDSLMVTDFAKAFDCNDYTLAIKNLLDLAVGYESIPWITDFLTSRRQRVQYQSALFEWKMLSYKWLTFIGMIDSAAADAKTQIFKCVNGLSLGRGQSSKQPSQIVKMFKTLMFGQIVTPSSSILPSVRLCRCVPRKKLTSPRILISLATNLRWWLRLLGLTVLSNRTWWLKSSRRLYMLNRLKRLGLAKGDLVTVIVSYVRPVVEYATPDLHGSLTDEQSKERKKKKKK